MIDTFDDLGTATRPYRVVACIPVYGRGPLLKQTIKRLYIKNGVEKVICVGNLKDDREICEAAGAYWVEAENKPLGKKWNIAFYEAKQFNPDACLYVGSSDWLSDNWLKVMQPYAEQYHLTGTPGCYFLDIGEVYRLCHWKGYVGPRQDETIGIGRLLSADLMEKLHWKPFDPDKDHSLDRSMKDKAGRFGVTDYMVRNENIKSLSLSTIKWVNKHFFNHHWNNVLPSEKINAVKDFLENNFPEALTLYEEIASIHQQ